MQEIPKIVATSYSRYYNRLRVLSATSDISRASRGIITIPGIVCASTLNVNWPKSPGALKVAKFENAQYIN